MIVAVKLEATNDSNGNPRRGWAIEEVKGYGAASLYRAESHLLAFADEGYRGVGALKDALIRNGWQTNPPVLGPYTITPRQYRELLRKPGSPDRS